MAINQGSTLQYNMFAYCLNNSVCGIDSDGTFFLSAFVGSMVGGAIGGAFISAISYAVGSMPSGNFNTTEMLLSMAAGAIEGAAAAGIGYSGVVGWTCAALSAKVGLFSGVCAGLLSGSPINGIIVGLSTTASCFTGAHIAISGYGAIGSAALNYCTTLMVGTPFELLSVGAQNIHHLWDEESSSRSKNNKTAGKQSAKPVASRQTSQGYLSLGSMNMSMSEFLAWALNTGYRW